MSQKTRYRPCGQWRVLYPDRDIHLYNITLNTWNWRKGVYSYCIMADGKITTRKKIAVFWSLPNEFRSLQAVFALMFATFNACNQSAGKGE